MEKQEIKAFGGLIKGSDEKNYSYSSGPFIRLRADSEKILICGIFSKIELKKNEVENVENFEIKKQVDGAIKTHRGIRFVHAKGDEKSLIVFTHISPAKVINKLKELGYEIN